MNKIIRNILIFAAVTLSAGFIGAYINSRVPTPDPMQAPGTALWLALPLLTVIILRTFGGDGWKDFGLWPNLKAGWIWYLAALLIPVLATLLVMGLGAMLGAYSFVGFSAQGLRPYLELMAATFFSVMVKNIFEEFAWRGYLTPRFAAAGVRPFFNYLWTGLIWAGWHVPYLLYFLKRSDLLSHTTFSVPVFILSAFITLPLIAVVFGEIRLLSNSVWPAWLMHNMANAISLPLLTYGFIQLNGTPGSLFSPGTEGILYACVMGLAGYGLYKYRTGRQAGEVKQKRMGVEPAV
jgi:hypothetical protein